AGERIGMQFDDWAARGLGGAAVVTDEAVTLDLRKMPMDAETKEIDLDPTLASAESGHWTAVIDNPTWAAVRADAGWVIANTDIRATASYLFFKGFHWYIWQGFAQFDTIGDSATDSATFHIKGKVQEATGAGVIHADVTDAGATLDDTDRTIGPDGALGNFIHPGVDTWITPVALSAAQVNDGGYTWVMLTENHDKADIDPYDPVETVRTYGGTFYGPNASSENQPFLTITAAVATHNLYRGVGGLSNVNFVTLLAQSVTSPITLTGEGHDANTKYTYALRP
ncbi:unnamed protein product, partial [marine sediment metagenome]